MPKEKILYHLIERSLEMSGEMLYLSKNNEENNIEEVLKILTQREIVFEILLSTYAKSKNTLGEEFKNLLNQLMDEIKKIDDIITSNLESQKERVQIEIAKVFKNKENFKGYNLETTK